MPSRQSKWQIEYALEIRLTSNGKGRLVSQVTTVMLIDDSTYVLNCCGT